MEEIDMNMTRIYNDMDEGFEILNTQKEIEIARIKQENDFRAFLMKKLEEFIPQSWQAYSHCIDLHYPENISPEKMRTICDNNENFRGWYQVRIPDFALIAVHVDMKAEMLFLVFDPAYTQDGLAPDDDWHECVLHKNIRDKRIALALAKQAWENFVKTANVPVAMSAGESHRNAEVYEAVDGEFGSFEIDEGYVQLMIDKRLKHYGLI
jgi:hypothetical protein